MSWPTNVQDAIDRLAAFYNGGAYDADDNAGGLAQGGHRTNFVPALQDVSTVGEALADIAEQAQDVEDTAFYWLGSAAANPTTMRNGTPLQEGAFYWNTGASRLRVYNGATWDEITQPVPYWSSPVEIDHTDGTVTDPYAAETRDVLYADATTAAVYVELPADGYVQVTDPDGTAGTHTIYVVPPSGETIGTGEPDEAFEIDVANFSAVFTRRSNGNWSVT